MIDINKSKIQVLGNTGVYVGGDNLDEKMIFGHFSKYLGKGAKQKLVSGGSNDIPISIFKDFSDKANLLFLNDKDFAKRLIPLLLNEEDKISLGRLDKILGDISIGYDFHSQVEKTKIELTNKETVQTNFNMFSNRFSSILTRSEFDKIINEDVEKIKLSKEKRNIRKGGETYNNMAHIKKIAPEYYFLEDENGFSHYMYIVEIFFN